MKLFNKSICGVVLAFGLMAGFCSSCEDACEYDDFNASNPSWVNGYNDSLEIAHPDSLAQQTWVRGEGIKYNAYGEEIQGYVESMDFITKDSVIVKMSQGTTEGTMGVDDSNTPKNPRYEYTYSNVTGVLEVLNEVEDDKGNKSKVPIFTGVAVCGSAHGDMLTVVHFGDTPAQTYLVRVK